MATRSIGSGGGRDYSTVQAWEDALPATLTENEIGEAYNDSEFSSTGRICTFAGVTTSASFGITLRAAAGQSFRDHASVQSNALFYSQTRGVAMRGNTGGYDRTIVIEVDYVTLSGLQLLSQQGGAAGGAVVSNSTSGKTNVVVEHCIVDGERNTVVGAGTITMVGGTLRNLLVITRGTGGNGISFSYPDANVLVLNVTLVRPTTYTAGGTALEALSGTTTAIRNCAVFGFTTFANNNARFTGYNNCADITIGFGTSNQESKTYSNQFENTATDFRIKTGADCVNNGATEAAASPDIANTTRPQSSAYDIGCWELVVAAGPPVPKFPDRGNMRPRMFAPGRVR